MIPLPSRSPFTGGEIIVTRFYCPESDTSVEGQFTVTNPFIQLSPEQIEFVELFVRSEGRISRMEGELALSYPTIRSRLKEIVLALGYEADPEDSQEERHEHTSGSSTESSQNKATSATERQRIIKELDEGKISFDEAMQQINNQ